MTYVFTATHGVEFADTTRARTQRGDWEETFDVWARFEIDSASTVLVDGVTVRSYRFETSDAKIAARLRKITDYGIAEAKPEPPGSPPAPGK